MTQEDKQLLIKDLCTRLPFGVKIHINSCIEEQNQMQLFDVNLEAETIGVRNEKWTFRAIPIIDDEDETKVIKPYLRPMSSMTEEEIDEIKSLLPFHCGDMFVNGDEIIVFETDGEFSLSHHLFEDMINFYNSHHFDYRGLIPMGLALEAPKDMYKTE